MKKIVAIMAVSLMLFTSCGKAKDLITPEINKDEEDFWSVNYIGNKASVVEGTISRKQVIIMFSVGLTVLVIELILVKCGCW
jgi:hypothetical protein